jgi:uncharacterized protein (TIGR03663 family)
LLLDHRLLRGVPRWREGSGDEESKTGTPSQSSDSVESASRDGDNGKGPRPTTVDGILGMLEYAFGGVAGIADRYDWRAVLVVLGINPLVLSLVLEPIRGLLGVSFGFSGTRFVAVPAVAAFLLGAGGLALIFALPMDDPVRVYLGAGAYYGMAFWLFLVEPGGAVTVLWFWLVWTFGTSLVADVAVFGRPGRDSARLPPIAGSYLLFVGILVLFYAPKGGATDAPGLWAAIGDPGGFLVMVEEALGGSWDAFISTWGGGSHQDHPYMSFFQDYVERMGAGAFVTSIFAAVGFVADRYSPDGPRDLVALGFYWGVASLFGYPIITDIMAPWSTVHTIVPLAIPAAVGLGLLYRWGRDAITDERTIEATLAVVIAVLVVGSMATVAYDTNYRGSDAERNEAFAHWTQPSNDFRWTLEQIERISADHDDGPDVMFYGSTRPSNPDERLFYVANESRNRQPPAPAGWFDRLPLPWYLERYNATVTSSPPDAKPSDALENPPPIVIAYSWDASEVKPHLGGYVAYRHRFKLWGEEVVVYIHKSHLATDDF